MYLYLVQHAEARPREQDSQRSLSDKGRSDIERVASFVGEQVLLKVDRILHSGKTRAQQTAEVLADYLAPSSGVDVVDGLEPMAEPSIWMTRLAGREKDLMLVGHLPHLERLAAKLICGDEAKSPVAFENAGVVCIGNDDSGHWSVRWMVTPGVLRGGQNPEIREKTS